MKHLNLLLLIGLTLLSWSSYGQTVNKKMNLSIGIGRQSYNGDLGNSWFKSKEECYVIVSFNFSRYLNKSFDLNTSLTMGDYGHCRDADESPYRPDGTEVLNMLCRLTSWTVSGKYKFANGYILKENSKVAPYVYLGAGINNISEYWWDNKTRATVGNYGSINGGLGARYNFNERFNLTYNLGFGYFSSDIIDKRDEGTNDMYMRHLLMFGINF